MYCPTATTLRKSISPDSPAVLPISVSALPDRWKRTADPIAPVSVPKTMYCPTTAAQRSAPVWPETLSMRERELPDS